MKIAALLPAGEYTKELELILQSFPHEVKLFTKLDEQTVEHLKEVEVLVSTPFFPLTRVILEKMAKLRFVQCASTGYDHLDVECLKQRGVIVSNVPDANKESVAEHVIMVTLCILRRLEYALQSTRNGVWVLGELASSAHELMGKSFGILGMGRIGRQLAKRLVPFEVTTLYYDLIRLNQKEEEELGASYVTLEELFRLSDIVSIHVPLNHSTHSMVNAKLLSQAKRGLILINAARAEIVEKSALLEALENGTLSAAALDVYENEPPNKDDPILKHPKILVTPHYAGVTWEAQRRIAHRALANVLLFVQGGTPVNQV